MKNTNPTSKIDFTASTIDSNASKLILDLKLKPRGGRLILFWDFIILKSEQTHQEKKKLTGVRPTVQMQQTHVFFLLFFFSLLSLFFLI